MTGLVDHFERVLGPIRTGWATDPDGARMPFQIVRFAGGSDADSVSYSTLGLSRQSFPSPTSGLLIRQELLMLAPERLPTDLVVSLLFQVGSTVFQSRRPLLRGDVIGPAGPLVSGSSLTAMFVTGPVYFPDEFAVCHCDDGEDVVIAWLIPISTSEADYISRHGWESFENLLMQEDPDLVDFHRPAVRGVGGT